MEELLKCEICQTTFNLSNHKPLTAKCGHTYCKHCILSSKDENNTKSCPHCNTPNLLHIESCIPNYKLEKIINLILNIEQPAIKKIVYMKPEIKRNRSPSTRTNYLKTEQSLNKKRSCTQTKNKNEYRFFRTHGAFFGGSNLHLNSQINKNEIDETLETIPFNDDKSVNLSFRDECKELLEENNEDDVKEKKKSKDNDFENNINDDEKEKETNQIKEEKENVNKSENKTIPSNDNMIKNQVYNNNRLNKLRERNKNVYYNNNINIKNNTNNVNVKIQNINIINTSPQLEQQTSEIYQEYKTVPNKTLISDKNTIFNSPENNSTTKEDKIGQNEYNSTNTDGFKKDTSKISVNYDSDRKNNRENYPNNIANLYKRHCDNHRYVNSHTTTISTIGISTIKSPSKIPNAQNEKIKTFNNLKIELSKYLPNSNDSYSQSRKRLYEEYLTKAINNKRFTNNYSSVKLKLFQNGDLYIGYVDPYTTKITNGILYATNGDYYDGEFVNDKKEGYGTLIYKNGTKYEGILKNNKHNGYGKLSQLDGEIFIGEWKEGKINGHGVRYHSNGDRYIGNYVNNIRNGNGHYIFSNGDSYEGNWINGKANGKGIFVFKNGNIYEGEFRDNLITGEGVFRMINGDIYSGTFRNGLIIGKGTLTNKLGEKFQGEFYNGKKHGYGKITSKEGKLICSGYWKMDSYLGSKEYKE